MFCPKCGAESEVIYSHIVSEKSPVRRRRRECPECKQRFVTYECTVESVKNGELEKAVNRIGKRDQTWINHESTGVGFDH